MNNDIDFNTVDELGMLQAQIADLTAKADAIKDAMKDIATRPGAGNKFEGAIFKATVVESNRKNTDWLALVSSKLGVAAEWEAVAAKIGYSTEDIPKVVAANTKVTAVYSVKVTSR